ncbi:MAG: TIGR02710 family CRISPR-associated CARF protein [Chloroflexales bacterium]|jgi:CRISPR-associated protein (TIGR02710 family)
MTTFDLPPDFVADVSLIVGKASVDGLITMGTGQVLTAAMLVAACKPVRLAIILTVGTEDFIDQLRQELLAKNVTCPTIEPILAPINPDDTKAIYQAIRQVIDFWPTGGRYLTDVTPGKKPMSVGVAKAATLLNLQTLYVNSKFVNNNVVPGSQRLIDLPDPYVVFGDLKARDARGLFNAHDYAGAKRIFAELAVKVPLPEGARYTAMKTLAEAYAHWDAFEPSDAVKSFTELFLHSLSLDLHLCDPEPLRVSEMTSVASETGALIIPIPLPLLDLQSYDKILHRQTDAATRLAAIFATLSPQESATLETLRSLPDALALLGALYGNAQRRKHQGRLDIAALFLYRCLELLSQQRLACYEILTESPDYRAVLGLKPTLPDVFRRTERRYFGSSRGLRGLTTVVHHQREVESISLFSGYMLLEALGDPLVADLNLNNIRNQIKIRNKGVLAHGFRPITEAEFNAFADLVSVVFDRFFAVSGTDRQEWERTFTFVELT